MKVNRILRILDDDPLRTLRRFLSDWWQRMELDAMLAPVELSDHGGTAPQVIDRPEDLEKVNPYLPRMLTNSAPLVSTLIKDHPNGSVAVIFRPCELRAHVELKKRTRTHAPQSAIPNHQKSPWMIGVDCLGTCSGSEFTRQLNQHSEMELVRAGLSYGCQDGSTPLPVRMACQMCDAPTPLGADLVIGSLGIAPQGYLIAIASNEDMDEKLMLAGVTDGMATAIEVNQRELAVGKLSERRSGSRSELIHKRSGQAEDLNSIMAMFVRCTLCADCLDECPLYDGELSGMLGVKEAYQRTDPFLTEVVGVSRWLASCSGCGMCQEVCEHGVSLTPILITLSHRIQQELNYRPGDPEQRLPWMT